MNILSVKDTASRLEDLLRRYAATDVEAQSLLSTLSALIVDARSGRITHPLEWRDIPGSRSFTEGGLGKYGDLETAFADFRIEITGGETPVLRDLRQSRDRKQ